MGDSDTKPKDTRDRILDAAESLFADHGFRDVSLREITKEARVNIAAVNYHFGSKDALTAEVLARVISPINQERLRLLGESEESSEGALPIEVILECLHRPVVNQLKTSGLNQSVYLKLAGRCLAEPAEQHSDMLVDLFREVISRFMAAASRSLPNIAEDDLFWKMHFAFGTMIYALTHGDRVALFSQGRIATPDAEEILRRLIAFTAAGIREGVPPETKKPKPRKGAATLSLLAAALLLSSCQTKSSADSTHLASVRAPAHWVAGPSWTPVHYPDRHWIETFGQSELSELVEKVLSDNKDLKAASSRIRIAESNARIAGADFYPRIDGNFSGQRDLQNFIGFPLGGAGAGPDQVFSSRFNQFGLSLNLTWEIDLWGRIAAARRASVAEFEASVFDRSTAELSLAGQAAKGWFALAEARDQAALAQETITIFSRTESAIRDRFEAGVEEAGNGFAAQLLLAESDVAAARDTLAAREELVGRASRQLEILAGDYPAGRAGQSAKMPAFPGKIPTGMPADLLDRRPDLAAAERRIAAADQRLLEAKRSLLPAISLTGRYGTASEDISNILDGSFSVWSIAGNALQPITQGGRLRANVKRNEAQTELAISEFEQTALVAFGEVENALAAERFLSERVDALLATVRVSEAAYDRSLNEFLVGTGDFLTLLSAQQRVFTSRSRLLSIRRQRLDNRVDLHLALGGSFRPLPAPLEKSTAPSES